MARFLYISKTVPKIVVSLTAIMFLSSKGVQAGNLSLDIERGVKRLEIKIGTTQEKIRKSKDRVDELEAQELPIIKELDMLNLRLNKLQESEREIRFEIARLKDTVKTIKAKRNNLRQEIKAEENYASERLVAFYKLGRVGVAPVIFSATSLSQFLQRKKALQVILQHDSDLWDTLQNKKGHLQTLGQQIMGVEQERGRLLLECKQKMSDITEQRDRRTELLETIRGDKEQTIKYLAALKKSAKKLDETIKTLREERDVHLPYPGFVPGTFFALKGHLLLPVQGKPVKPFGPYEIEGRYGINGFRNGITFCADRDLPVRAVSDGRVIYADWFNGYGNIIIIDHGNHYYTLSAQLGEPYKKRGDLVLAGEVIGTVGDIGQDAGRGLYFEIRHYGKSVDPTAWLSQD